MMVCGSSSFQSVHLCLQNMGIYRSGIFCSLDDEVHFTCSSGYQSYVEAKLKLSEQQIHIRGINVIQADRSSNVRPSSHLNDLAGCSLMIIATVNMHEMDAYSWKCFNWFYK